MTPKKTGFDAIVVSKPPKRAVPMSKADRREAALLLAIKLAKKVGAKRVSMAMVAAAMKVTAPLLFHIFESREGLHKAIIKRAKKDGVALPEGAPTVREARVAARKPRPAVKKVAPLKKLKAVLKPLPKLKAPVKSVKRTRSIKEVKAIKNKVSTPVAKAMTVKAKKGEDLRKLSCPELVARARKRPPLNAAQREAKAARDKARRNPSPAAKFAALPAPFEAAIQQVAA